jgi:hypothetical protein
VDASADRAKDILRQITNQVIADSQFKGLIVSLDVDPI